MNYTTLKTVDRWLTRGLASCVIVFMIVFAIWLSDGAADKEGKYFAEQFYEDLLEKDYESIHSYVFRAEEYDISVEDVERYLSDEDLVFILEHKENLTYEESGGSEHRQIIFTTVVDGKTYSYGIRITRSLGSFYIHPERDYFLNDYNK